MNEVRVRRATLIDIEALVDLEQAAFVVERMSARQLRRHLDSVSAEVFVATRAHCVVGAAVTFFRRTSHVARLYSIAVTAAERGRGIGETLLATAERAARKRGSTAMRLEVRADNAAAQRLYEDHGYRRSGEYHAYYQDGHDAFRYMKPLGSRNARRSLHAPGPARA